MKNKHFVRIILYLSGIALNLIWIVLMTGLVIAILNHRSTEYILTSVLWRAGIFISSLASLLLLLYNIRMIASRSQELLIVLIAGNFFINPFVSISLLRSRVKSSRAGSRNIDSIIMRRTGRSSVRKILYLSSIAFNFIWIVLVAKLGSAIYNDSAEMYLRSMEYIVGFSISSLISLILFFYNIRLIKPRSKILFIFLVSGILFINPFVSVLLLLNGFNPENPISNQKIDYRLILRTLYKACNWMNTFFICYFILTILSLIVYNPLGELMLIPFSYIMVTCGLAGGIIYYVNYSISLVKDAPGASIKVILGFFIYTPFYSRKVLQNRWI